MAGTTEGGKKGAEADRGDPKKASPAAIENYIKGIKFPADKNKLIEQAERNKAPSDVINVLKKFEEKEYHSPIDISKEVGKVSK
jgi:hypothetical protein